ncbi:hypothetical protein J2S65_005178 [Rhodococcus fascians]|nr:hypothetical protein [Rhodococcus fascians]
MCLRNLSQALTRRLCLSAVACERHKRTCLAHPRSANQCQFQKSSAHRPGDSNPGEAVEVCPHRGHSCVAESLLSNRSTPRRDMGNHQPMVLSLEVVAESLSRSRKYVVPSFGEDPGFNPAWWSRGGAKSPVVYCRFLDGDIEVARAKVLPGFGEYRGYTSWVCPPGGATEIELIEVRVDLCTSGSRYGRQAVAGIAHRFGEPVVAMSLGKTSDGFWQALGWTAHLHPNGDSDRSYRTLFTSV